MPLDAQARFIQLTQLIGDMPDLSARPISDDKLRWFGRVRAILIDANDIIGASALDANLNVLHSSLVPRVRYNAVDKIKAAVFNAIAEAELNAPAAARGAFVAVGSAFDAFAAVSKFLGPSKDDVLIIDAYMDHNALESYAVLAPEGVRVRLLADHKHHKATLKPAIESWAKQYGKDRPLEARLAKSGALHDRSIMVDGTNVWLLSQSTNAFAARSPATIQRADPELALQKIEAYKTIWNAATPFP